MPAGGDEFLRQMMRVGNLFKTWACGHVVFEEPEDVWPYLLEDRFGAACLEVMFPFTADDDSFDENYGAPIYSIHGVDDGGLLEHITGCES